MRCGCLERSQNAAENEQQTIPQTTQEGEERQNLLTLRPTPQKHPLGMAMARNDEARNLRCRPWEMFMSRLALLIQHVTIQTIHFHSLSSDRPGSILVETSFSSHSHESETRI
ncbi:hypothetical protein DMENIID0001_161290 [Sergentomyia squamirostris]